MTIQLRRRTLLGAATGLVLSVGAVGLAGTASAESTPSPTKTADAALKSALVFGKEEERMARDLYTLFATTYARVRPFAEIAASETRHMGAMDRLLSAHGIADPSTGRAAGSYADQAIQKLYDDWKTQGLKSKEEAFKVGIALEKRDIADLKSLVADVDDTYVAGVLGRLLTASEHHLTAFETVLAGKALPEQGHGEGRMRGQGRGGDMGSRRGDGTGPGRQDADGDGVCDVTGQPVGEGQPVGQGQQPGGRGQGRRGR